MPVRRTVLLSLAAACCVGRTARAQAPQQVDPWPDLAASIFGRRTLLDGAQVLAIDAPTRAEDAAVVPVTLRSLLPPGDQRRLRRITLTIDDNPSPLAATFDVGPRGPDRFSLRVRVDSYTNLHAVAELDDGGLYATRRFVKAAGGCSAPAATAQAGGPPLGTMRLRQFEASPREALLMIRHPNNSGMQMDQLTRLYVPAHFIEQVRFAADDSLLFSATLGISVAENPQFRFPLPPGPARLYRAQARDNTGADFKGEWPAANAA